MHHIRVLDGLFVVTVSCSAALSQQPLASLQGPFLFGQHVAGVGDVNRDGISDVAIATPETFSVPGSVRVVSGIDGTVLHDLTRPIGTGFAASIAGVGDVNGDGAADLAVGAPFADAYSGESIPQAGMAEVISGADGSTLHTFRGQAMFDHFGTSVAGGGDVDGDGYDDVAVGAPQDHPRLGGFGYVRVYSGRDGGVLHTLGALSVEDVGIRFGHSVAILGDVDGDRRDDVAVGLPGIDFKTGAVRVFSGANGQRLYEVLGVRRRQAYGRLLSAVGDADGDGLADLAVGFRPVLSPFAGVHLLSGANGAFLRGLSPVFMGFGLGMPHSVAGVGDYDGDGCADVAVGRLGHAVVYSGRDGSPLCVRASTMPGTSTGFGTAVASAGDVDRDGYPDLIIGSPGEGPGRGGAYVYRGGPCMHREVGALSPAAGGSLFGRRIAALTDWNGDGVAEYAVGAMLESSQGRTRNGVVRVFSGADNREVLSLHGTTNHQFFGSAVGNAGDVDGDGVGDLVVGAYGDRSAGLDAGKIVVYSGATAGVLHVVVGSAPGDLLGSAVDGLGDVDGDGFDDFLASARGAGAGRGSVRVYSGRTAAPLYAVNGPLVDQGLGTSARAIGDFDGDGVTDFGAGAPQLLPQPTGPGSVRVYSGATGAVLRVITGAGFGSGFGQSLAGGVDLDGDAALDLVIGAPEGSRNGEVWLFSGGPAIVRRLGIGAGLGDRYGAWVECVGDVDGDGVGEYAVGAPFADVALADGVVLADAGTASILSVHGMVAVQTVQGAAADEGVGASVAALGDTNGDGSADFAVGAPSASPNGPQSGAVRIFQSTPPRARGFYDAYGVSCPGSSGTLPRASGGVEPRPGIAIDVGLRAAPAGMPAVLLIGGARASVGLAAIGMPGCVLATQPLASLPGLTDATGTATATLAVPGSPSLVGGVVDVQWAIADALANPLGLVASHGLEAVIGG